MSASLWLRIDETDYRLSFVPRSLTCKLMKADGTAYEVDRRCTCPDWVYRKSKEHSGRGCKHQVALREVGLLDKDMPRDLTEARRELAIETLNAMGM